MDIKRDDIIDYINGYPIHQQNADIIKMELYELYNICGDENKKYVIDINVNAIVNDNKENNNIYNVMKNETRKTKITRTS